MGVEIANKLHALGFDDRDPDASVLRALNELEALRKPLLTLEPDEAVRHAIARLSARAKDLGEDALLLGYLIGAVLLRSGGSR